MSRSFKQYVEDLRAAPGRLKREQLPQVAKRAAGEAQRRGKILVSRRFVNRTGRLRRSVRGRALLGDPPGFALLAGGPLVPYARIHEFGGTITFRTRRGVVRLRARRYLRDARDSVQATLGPELQKAIRAVYIPRGP